MRWRMRVTTCRQGRSDLAGRKYISTVAEKKEELYSGGEEKKGMICSSEEKQKGNLSKYRPMLARGEGRVLRREEVHRGGL